MTIALIHCGSVQGSSYCKWTDENGVVHYAEKCPDQAGTAKVDIQAPPSQDRIQEAQERADTLLSGVEARKRKSEKEAAEREAARSSGADVKKGRSERCLDAMVDLHNLREGEAMYFDENGELHDQFSIHSASYSGERTYLGDAEHKALIEARQRTVQIDCDQSREEIIKRIRALAARSDSSTCRQMYERVLKEKRFDRSTALEELQSIEATVLDVCN